MERHVKTKSQEMRYFLLRNSKNKHLLKKKVLENEHIYISNDRTRED
uniref:Uncharacterized protein n=1 Tax=Nelumbo nucifera TaxID=4432 RepID=A0A822XWA9_NELNU|nr:TPA_asm: hypothetical protein HUJ06_024749 [Nelumbo nucifera]